MSNRKQKADKRSSASLLQNCLLPAVPYQKCPICEGTGRLPAEFSGTVINIPICDVCGGAKIIPMHIVEQKLMEHGG